MPITWQPRAERLDHGGAAAHERVENDLVGGVRIVGMVLVELGHDVSTRGLQTAEEDGAENA
jgi:hypothetical protein